MTSGPPWLLALDRIGPGERAQVGGKAFALARLLREGFAVPDAVVLTTGAYDRFVDANRLRDRIGLELGRKPLDEMRWEEVWDTALRIRHLFLSHPLPDDLSRRLEAAVAGRFAGVPLAVRSSAPDEDGERSSFAGLHDSFVNVLGGRDLLDRVRQVWASLWSDAALLYRRELGLRLDASAMAVIVQRLSSGDRSGVAFSVGPVDPDQAVLEAVYGLNQGLVDGAVAPDRWTLDRRTRRLAHFPPEARSSRMAPGPGGVRLEPLPAETVSVPPLSDLEAREVLETAMGLEERLGLGVDMEWTFQEGSLVLLQVRPVTAGSGTAEGGDRRPWYLSLHRSFESLKALRVRIETEHLPEMARSADLLAGRDLKTLDAGELAAEIGRRVEINGHWSGVYWREFIPMAHGARLFGQVYNDRVKPDDPFEFVALLAGTDLKSLDRNRRLAALARALRDIPDWEERLGRDGLAGLPDDIRSAIQAVSSAFGGFLQPVPDAAADPSAAALRTGLLRQFVRLGEARGPRHGVGPDAETLRRRYLNGFPDSERPFALDLLDLARASYRLRDDDNIVLGRVEAEMNQALAEARQRLSGLLDPHERELLEAAVGSAKASGGRGGEGVAGPLPVRARQLVGQPAGAGIARGPARVVSEPGDLYRFEAGEVLVCDAVDPNMTFVVPLASAVVERRGGMLIHGAIIAREYGLPCVTGVPEATRLIRTGDPLTVDGYLGIVVVERTPPPLGEAQAERPSGQPPEMGRSGGKS